ncbi:MAG: MBL fold metallo-hydrolase [Planctomycetes bacterium]|nr:MBL fold metallo-hydrolase [Planctomycetota bacterium]MCL4731660.1 ferredoxin [Planctomycetota bacterium]
MPDLNKRRPENTQGPFYVDATCIDCDACRWIAPASFREVDGQSAVYAQPAGDAAQMAALQALVACPTASIGVTDPALQARTKDAVASFPRVIAGNVHHCGFHAENSFGAASWFITRPNGNVMVDSPRFAMPLVRRIEQLGGIQTLFLTHVDDIADHEKWARHFHCRRVMHADDARGLNIEHPVHGRAPHRLDDELLVIPTPGHTRGSACLLYADKYLFTGDHLAWSPRRGHLVAFRDACWYSWDELKVSMRALADFRFEWVLPGHGRMHHAPAAEMAAALQRCLDWL